MEQENFPQFLGILTSNYYLVQSRLTKRLCLSTAKLLLKPNKEITRDIVFKIIIMVDSEEKMIFIQPTKFTKIKVTSDQKMLNKLKQGGKYIYIYIYIFGSHPTPLLSALNKQSYQNLINIVSHEHRCLPIELYTPICL